MVQKFTDKDKIKPFIFVHDGAVWWTTGTPSTIRSIKGKVKKDPEQLPKLMKRIKRGTICPLCDSGKKFKDCCSHKFGLGRDEKIGGQKLTRYQRNKRRVQIARKMKER